MKMFVRSKIILLALCFSLSLPMLGSFQSNSSSSSMPSFISSKLFLGAGTGILTIASAAALFKRLINYKEIRALDKKRDLDHLLLGDEMDSETKFYKWELQKWSTARHIDQHWKEVIRRFITLSKNKNFRVINEPQIIIPEPTWQQVSMAIQREKTELWEDIKTLEKKHVVYLDWMPEYFDPFGIQKDYKEACYAAPKNNKGERAQPQSPGSWTQEQERFINEYIEQSWDKHILFRLVKPNYRYAAQTYWKLYTIWQRLNQLQRLLEEVEAGFAHASVRDSSDEKIIHYIMGQRAR